MEIIANELQTVLSGANVQFPILLFQEKLVPCIAPVPAW